MKLRKAEVLLGHIPAGHRWQERQGNLSSA
jgi:hypothetical protein